MYRKGSKLIRYVSNAANQNTATVKTRRVPRTIKALMFGVVGVGTVAGMMVADHYTMEDVRQLLHRTHPDYIKNKHYLYPHVPGKKFNYIEECVEKVEVKQPPKEKEQLPKEIKKKTVVDPKKEEARKQKEKEKALKTQELLNPQPIELNQKDALEQYKEMMASGLQMSNEAIANLVSDSVISDFKQRIRNMSRTELKEFAKSLVYQLQNSTKIQALRLVEFSDQYLNRLITETNKVIAENEEEFNTMKSNLLNETTNHISAKYKAEADLILSTERKKVFKTFNFLGTDSQEQYIHQRYQLEKDLIEDWRVTINAMENKKYNEHQEKCKEDIEEYRKLERDIIVSYKILSQQVKDQSICFDITNLSSAVSDLSNCLLYNKSYKNELERVKKLASKDPYINQLLSHLPSSISQKGIPTKSQLYHDFKQLKNVCLTLQYVPPNSGFGGELLGRITAKLLIKPRTRSLEVQKGQTTLAILKRSENYLNQGSIERAVCELEELSSSAGVGAKEWIELAKDRLIAEQIITVLQDYILSLHESIV